MVFAGMLGFMGVWPAVRLSQVTSAGAVAKRKARGTRPGGAGGPGGAAGPGVSMGDWLKVSGATWRDWLALNLVFQAVIWPLRLASGWEVSQTAWLAAAVAGWSLMTGLLIAWGRGSNAASRRTGAMVICVGVVVAEPLLWWLAWRMGVLGGVGERSMRLSPLQALWQFTATDLNGRTLQSVIQRQGVQVIAVAAAAVVGWLVLVGLLGLMRRADRRSL